MYLPHSESEDVPSHTSEHQYTAAHLEDSGSTLCQETSKFASNVLDGPLAELLRKLSDASSEVLGVCMLCFSLFDG